MRFLFAVILSATANACMACSCAVEPSPPPNIAWQALVEANARIYMDRALHVVRAKVIEQSGKGANETFRLVVLESFKTDGLGGEISVRGGPNGCDYMLGLEQEWLLFLKSDMRAVQCVGSVPLSIAAPASELTTYAQQLLVVVRALSLTANRLPANSVPKLKPQR